MKHSTKQAIRAWVALIVAVALLVYSTRARAEGWTTGACSRAVLRCGADLSACEERLVNCDKQRRTDALAWADRFASASKANAEERTALRREIGALRALRNQPAPWWESPVVWGVVGLVGGGLAMNVACRALGGCR